MAGPTVDAASLVTGSSTSSTTVVVNLPIGTVDGDWVELNVTTSAGTATYTCPGFTVVATSANSAKLVKQASGEPASYTITASGAAANLRAFAFRVMNSAGIDAATLTRTNAAGAHNGAAVSAISANTLHVSTFISFSGTLMTYSNSMTLGFDSGTTFRKIMEYETVAAGTTRQTTYSSGATSLVGSTGQVAWAPTAGATGTLATTLDDTTLAASASEDFTGTLSTTLDDTTLAAAGTETISGPLTATLDDTTTTSSGTVANPVTGTLATTLDDAVLAATSAEDMDGTLAVTLDDTTLAASGSVGAPAVTGTLASTLDDTTLAAAGTETISGTFTVTLDDVSLVGAGSETFAGTLAATLSDTTLVASGTETVSGTLVITLDDTGLAAGGTETITGQLAATLDGATLNAHGIASTGPARDIIVSVTIEAPGRAAVIVASPHGADVYPATFHAQLQPDPRSADPGAAPRTARVEVT